MIRAALAPLASLLILGTSQAEILYETDFDDFPTGDNAWAGFDGWLTNDRLPNDDTSGAQAIDDGLFSGALGKTAAIGFNQPLEAFTFVVKPINYDPEGGDSQIEFQMLFGIEDSTSATNFRRDDFFFSIYNIAGESLAAIRISNTDADFGFWRRTGKLAEAGGTEVDTGQDFIHGELYNLSGIIDLASNRWTAAIDGAPIFSNALFNGTGKDLTLGLIGIEWEVALGIPLAHGDNWMLVGDLRIETVEAPPPPVIIDSIRQDPAGEITITWQAHPGFDYLVEYSSDLITWLSDLPNSSKPAPVTEETFEFSDLTAPQAQFRFYRVSQSSAP